MQFYNQGASEYTDCTGLLTSSGGTFPGTSVFEIASAGIDLNKIVIGKPASAADASNGYMDTSTLASCVAEAQGKGWNAGVMTWEVSICHLLLTVLCLIRSFSVPHG